jgi:co-chaperonin GroES (HSP10)
LQNERLNFKAVGDAVLVENLRPTKSAGGIVLVMNDLRKWNLGRVVSVGPKVRTCDPGDIVVWEVFKGQAAGQTDDERWFLRDADILAKVSNPPKWVVEEIARRDAGETAGAK